MHKFFEKIRDWEIYTFKTRNNELKINALGMFFTFIFFIPVCIFTQEGVGSELLTAKGIILGIVNIFFNCLLSFMMCIIPGFFCGGLCYYIMKVAKINRPINGIIATFFALLLVISAYLCYLAFYPIGEYQILIETFISKKQNCGITVIHKKKCDAYGGTFQEKEELCDFIREKNTMYCPVCIKECDAMLLDAYSYRNNVQEFFDEDYKLKDYEVESGFYAYYGLDLKTGKFKKISSEDIRREYTDRWLKKYEQ